jgi:hypothetical protein
MKERSIQMRALMTARNSPDCWDLRCDVRRGLIEFLVREYPDCLPAARLSVVDGRSSNSELSGPPTKRRPLDTWIDDLHPEHRAHDSSPQAG